MQVICILFFIFVNAKTTYVQILKVLVDKWLY